ncbi:MAG: zinc ribbon domain-containing protein [Eubacteriales bacterium]|nr:zinc ribbon domain-containing protein [Eubacteriales bacterium]
MLCKNCGKELPIAGQFCPFCGAPVEQQGVNDETAAFTTLPEELNGPIDLTAFDAAMKEGHHTGAPADRAPRRPADAQDPYADVPPVRRSPAEPPRTTYFGQPNLDDRPYRKPSKGKRGAVVALVVLLVLALIGGGVWYLRDAAQPNEELTLAERYLKHGDFAQALDAYYAAQSEVKDPAALDGVIHLLEDLLAAQDYMENEQFTEAVAALKQLQNRVSDPASPLFGAVADLLDEAQAAQAEHAFAADIAEAQAYLDAEKFDACAAKLDSLAADDTLTDDQRKQVATLRESLDEVQTVIHQQQEDDRHNTEQKERFRDRVDALEQTDLQIATAATLEDELALTAGSFEQWDGLLMQMYDHLATILNADRYAAEEASFRQWVDERDSGAENAAKECEDELTAELAAYSFKQSYTKARCYKLLDMM